MSTPSTSNISIGTIPNYKALATCLGMPVKTGKAKMLQLEEIERHINFSRKGNAYKVLEIYKEPKEAIMKPIKNSLWADHLGLVILHELSKSLKTGKEDEEINVYIERHKLITVSGLCHPDFYKRRGEYEALETSDGKVVDAFFNKATSKFSDIYRTVTNGFKRRYSVTCMPKYLFYEAARPDKRQQEASDHMVKEIEQIKGDALEAINVKYGYKYTSFTVYRGAYKQEYLGKLQQGYLAIGITRVSKVTKFIVTPTILKRIARIETDLALTVPSSKASLNTSMMGYMGKTMHQWSKQNGRIVFVEGSGTGQHSLPVDMLQYKDMIEGCIKYFNELEGEIE